MYCKILSRWIEKQEYTKSLGNAVKQARDNLGYTQARVAELADIDVRTVLNIENFKGNPKLEVLYPLIRALHIDAQTVFYPEQGNQTPLKSQLQMLIGQCSEEEARVLIPVIESLLSALRDNTNESL